MIISICCIQVFFLNLTAAQFLEQLNRLMKCFYKQFILQALYHLSRNNPYARQKILDEGAVSPLLQILKRTRTPPLQEAISLTLWSLAGSDINEKRLLASMMGRWYFISPANK